MINIAQETLDFRCPDFSSELSLLMPTFAFPYAPAWLTPNLHCLWNVPLPFRKFGIHNFGKQFKSRVLSTLSRLTSELLRTL